MPLTHFREGLGDGAVDVFHLGDKSAQFGVSLTAAALRWVKSTSASALLILSRDGFMNWAVPSDRALKNGAYFKTKATVCEIPAASVTGSGVTEKRGQAVAAGVWFPHADQAAILKEMTVVCDNYGNTLTLLCLSRTTDVAAGRLNWPARAGFVDAPTARLRVDSAKVLDYRRPMAVGVGSYGSEITFSAARCDALLSAPTTPSIQNAVIPWGAMP